MEDLVKALETLKGDRLTDEEKAKIIMIGLNLNRGDIKTGPIGLLLEFWAVVIDIISTWINDEKDEEEEEKSS